MFSRRNLTSIQLNNICDFDLVLMDSDLAALIGRGLLFRPRILALVARAKQRMSLNHRKVYNKSSITARKRIQSICTTHYRLLFTSLVSTLGARYFIKRINPKKIYKKMYH